MIRRFLPVLAVCLLLFSGCTTTPVSGRQALILVPLSQEMALGAQAYQEVLKKETLSRDPDQTAVVQRVGRRIASVSSMPNLPWEFTLIESKQQNAFALPGGKTAVYTGILPVCANEAGLAAVMGHEIAHVIARHGAQRLTQDMLIGLGMTAAAISMADRSQRGLILGALGLGVTLGVSLPFSRSMEAEADEIGLIYMARAGYDPDEAERFWVRFAKMKQGPQPPEFLSTHPADSTRIRKIRALLPRARAIYQRNPNQYGLGESFLVLMNRDRLPAAEGPAAPPPASPSGPPVSVETLQPGAALTAPPASRPAMHLDEMK